MRGEQAKQAEAEAKKKEEEEASRTEREMKKQNDARKLARLQVGIGGRGAEEDGERVEEREGGERRRRGRIDKSAGGGARSAPLEVAAHEEISDRECPAHPHKGPPRSCQGPT